MKIVKTLRDELAMVALPTVFMDAKQGAAYLKIAQQAYLMADAMLKARESSSSESPTRT